MTAVQLPRCRCEDCLDRAEQAPERVPTFAEQVVEAIDELVEAKIDYSNSRRSIGGEYANGDEVSKAQDKLVALLGRVAA